MELVLKRRWQTSFHVLVFLVFGFSVRLFDQSRENGRVLTITF